MMHFSICLSLLRTAGESSGMFGGGCGGELIGLVVLSRKVDGADLLRCVGVLLRFFAGGDWSFGAPVVRGVSMESVCREPLVAEGVASSSWSSLLGSFSGSPPSGGPSPPCAASSQHTRNASAPADPSKLTSVTAICALCLSACSPCQDESPWVRTTDAVGAASSNMVSYCSHPHLPSCSSPALQEHDQQERRPTPQSSASSACCCALSP